MNLTYLYVEEFGEMDAFFDGDRVVHYWFGNDANYRPEYMNKLFEYGGIHIKHATGVKRIAKLKQLLRERVSADIGYDIGDEG